MIDKFWESLGGDLAGEWLRHAFSPPFLFYLSGLGFYILRHGWRSPWNWLLGLETVEQIVLLILVLTGLVLSALLSARWRFTLLRWMEGYWPWPLRWLEQPLIQRRRVQLEIQERRLNAMLASETHDPRALRHRAELEAFVHYHPADAAEIRPTRLGNILRAGETAPKEKYGLDANVCWPRLWTLLPAHLRDDLSAVRTRLLTLAEIWGMGMLSLIWVVWSPWALVLAAVWMWAVYQLALPVAMSYADLIESAFDLHRSTLYDALHWPRPKDSKNEASEGQKLTEFLWRGTLDAPIRYEYGKDE